MGQDASGLKVWQKIFYGLGDMTGTISYTVIQFLFAYYLTDVVGLSASLAWIVMFVVPFLQAFFNIIAGYASDTAQSRFGRRRIFFIATVIPYAVTFFLLWIIPAGVPQTVIFFMALGFYTLYTAVNAFYATPYATYSMELEGGYDGRTSLVAYRMFVSIFFGLVAAVLPTMLVDGFGGGNPGYMWMGLVFAVSLLGGPLFVFFARKEEPFNHAPKEKVLPKFVSTLKNRHFVKAMLLYVFNWVAIAFVQTFLMYYLKYILRLDQDFDIIVGILMGVAVLALPLWVFISKKMDKRKAYILGVSVFLFFILSLALPAPVIKPFIWVITPLLGVGISCMHVMPSAIVPEAIELGSGKLSLKDQGTHFGVMSFFQSIGNAAMIPLAIAVLGWLGYKESTGGAYQQQPEAALTAIQVMVVTIPSLLLAGAIVSAALFRIGRKEHAGYIQSRTDLNRE